MNEPVAIEVEQLVKRYGSTMAVDGLSFGVRAGEVFGLLGPNGAGKTTTVECIEGLRTPDSGAIHVLGLDVRKELKQLKQRIGIQLQATNLYHKLSVREVIDLFASFYDHPLKTDQVIAWTGLQEKEKTRTKQLSGGQQQRLSVALALVNDPSLLFLDEPTTGLDPQARHAMWELIEQMHAQGKTILMTTHYMEEAERLCDRVAIMDHGKIIALDQPQALVRQYFQEQAIEFSLSTPAESLWAGAIGNPGLPRASAIAGAGGAPGMQGAAAAGPGVSGTPVQKPALRQADRSTSPWAERLGSLPGVSHVQVHGQTVTCYSADVPASMGGLLEMAKAGEIAFDDLTVRRATLEDVFLKLTGRTIRE